METKKIEAIIAPPAPHFVGDGFRVHGFIPGSPRLSHRRMDPFLILDYNSKINFPPKEIPRGVGVHPHRGFETVTIAYQGSVAHHDSSGGGGVIHQGDVQWMTAASGILHKEYHDKEFSQKGGDFQMVQLWVNLPAKDKMSPPKYQAIKAKEIPKHILENNAGTIEVIAGEYKATKGAAFTFTPINMYNAKLHKGGQANFSFPENYTTLLLVIEGSVKVNQDTDIPLDQLALFNNKGTDFTVEATEEAIVLILSGAPINEPIATHGPFVMNTREELLQAFQDFNAGKFGYLEE